MAAGSSSTCAPRLISPIWLNNSCAKVVVLSSMCPSSLHMHVYKVFEGVFALTNVFACEKRMGWWMGVKREAYTLFFRVCSLGLLCPMEASCGLFVCQVLLLIKTKVLCCSAPHNPTATPQHPAGR